MNAFTGSQARVAVTAEPEATRRGLDVAAIYQRRRDQISGDTTMPEPEATGTFIDQVYAARARRARAQ